MDASGDTRRARLVLGPMLRYVGPDDATVWVEADAPCEVEVLGARARTFAVAGHHYALVHVTGLEPGRLTEYEVRLDGALRWPPEAWDGPPSSIRALADPAGLRLVFGSCRVAVPHDPPWTLTKDADPLGKERDALRALAHRMRGEPPNRWPDALLLLGDQVYADEGSPRARGYFRTRRDTSVPPGLEASDYEEYTRLYLESWQEPLVRWLLSVVPSAMIFDDHEVHDDWNTSESWVREMWRLPWWEERLVGAYMSYWVYQHLGNLSPRDLAEDPVWAEVRDAGDATAALRTMAARSARTPDGSRWSYSRELGRTRLVVLDSRGGRLLRDGRRAMVDDEEWAWIEARARGGVDHLLLATSLPAFLAPGMQELERWSEAVCDGAWGPPGRWVGERARRGLDLEHWGAFGKSWLRLVSLIRDVGAGERGEPPTSIVLLSGDVHHAYVAQVAFPRSAGVRSAVYQAVCSPFRNPLDRGERLVVRFGASAPAAKIGRALSASAGVAAPPVRWRLEDPPVFDNQVATLELAGRSATLRIERARPDGAGARLDRSVQRRLA